MSLALSTYKGQALIMYSRHLGRKELALQKVIVSLDVQNGVGGKMAGVVWKHGSLQMANCLTSF